MLLEHGILWFQSITPMSGHGIKKLFDLGYNTLHLQIDTLRRQNACRRRQIKLYQNHITKFGIDSDTSQLGRQPEYQQVNFLVGTDNQWQLLNVSDWQADDGILIIT